MSLVHHLQQRGYRLRTEGNGNHRVLGFGGLIVKGDAWYWFSKGRGGTAMTLLAELGENYDDLDSHKGPPITAKTNTTLQASLYPLGPESRDYLYLRGIPADLIQQLSQKKLIFEDGKGYICFPSYDEKGQLKALSKRAIDPLLRVPKYDERGSDRRWCYHLPGPSQNKKIVLVEGPIDALSIACMGNLKHGRGYFEIPVMATGGSPSSQWLRRCRYFKGLTVYIAFDLDHAGQQMAQKLQGQLETAGACAVVVQGEGKDPNEWWLNLRQNHR